MKKTEHKSSILMRGIGAVWTEKKFTSKFPPKNSLKFTRFYCLHTNL